MHHRLHVYVKLSTCSCSEYNWSSAVLNVIIFGHFLTCSEDDSLTSSLWSLNLQVNFMERHCTMFQYSLLHFGTEFLRPRGLQLWPFDLHVLPRVKGMLNIWSFANYTSQMCDHESRSALQSQMRKLICIVTLAIHCYKFELFFTNFNSWVTISKQANRLAMSNWPPSTVAGSHNNNNNNNNSRPIHLAVDGQHLWTTPVLLRGCRCKRLMREHARYHSWTTSSGRSGAPFQRPTSRQSKSRWVCSWRSI